MYIFVNGYSEGLHISNGSRGRVGLGQGRMNAVNTGRCANKADIYLREQH